VQYVNNPSLNKTYKSAKWTDYMHNIHSFKINSITVMYSEVLYSNYSIWQESTLCG